MHAHTAATGDEPNDRIARYRGATDGEPHQYIVEPLDVNTESGLAVSRLLAAGTADGRRRLLSVVA